MINPLSSSLFLKFPNTLNYLSQSTGESKHYALPWEVSRTYQQAHFIPEAGRNEIMQTLPMFPILSLKAELFNVYKLTFSGA